MEKEWNAIDTLRARVTQVYREEDSSVRTALEGKLSVRRPRCLRFDFGRSATAEVSLASAEAVAEATAETDPDFTVFTTDGEYLYEYSRVEKTLTRDSIAGLDSMPFLKAVAGIEGFNEERFNQEFYVVAPVLEERMGSVPVYGLRVRPRPQYEAERQSFDLWVGCEDGLPRRIVLYLPQETIEVFLDGFALNQPIPAEEFEVPVPPDVQLLNRTEEF